MNNIYFIYFNEGNMSTAAFYGTSSVHFFMGFVDKENMKIIPDIFLKFFVKYINTICCKHCMHIVLEINAMLLNADM